MARQGIPPADWKVVPLGSDPITICETNPDDRLQLGNPSVTVMPSGRTVVAVNQGGPGLRNLPGVKGRLTHYSRLLQGRLFVTNDRGKTWQAKHDFPLANGQLFRDGALLYLAGHDDDVQIMRSPDGGETWSKPEAITASHDFGDTTTATPSSVLAANGHIYMAALRVTDFAVKGDASSIFAPVILRATEGANLATRKSWTVSEPAAPFSKWFPPQGVDYTGLPFLASASLKHGQEITPGRRLFQPGWHAPQLARIHDASHIWHDPAGKTLHLLAPATLQRSQWAALLRITETGDGKMQLGYETTPAGQKLFLLPVPGGNLKFALFYDEPSSRYWLLSQQATDSMTRTEKMPDTRSRMACDECHRLQLHFSRNLVDWCFAGYIAGSANPRESWHSPAMAVRGQDLCVVCCAGTAENRNAFETHRIVALTVPQFRDLVY